VVDAVRWIPICLLHLLSIGLLPAQDSKTQVTIKAAQSGDKYMLEACEVTQVTDGATLKFVIFRGENHVFRYTPPPNWNLSFNGGKAVCARGKVTATVALSMPDYASGVDYSTADQIKNFREETLSRVRGLEVNPPAILPCKVGDQLLFEIAVSYNKAGQARLLQRVKGASSNWQLEVEIDGPARDFIEAAPDFVRSICSLERRTNEEMRSDAAVLEREALSRLAAESIRTEEPKGARKVRGRLP
jgi:hypothetical protein